MTTAYLPLEGLRSTFPKWVGLSECRPYSIPMIFNFYDKVQAHQEDQVIQDVNFCNLIGA